MRNILVYTALVLVASGCSFTSPRGQDIATTVRKEQSSVSDGKLQKMQIVVNDIPLLVEVARTAEEKAQGLSGRTGLADGTGMLFIFKPPIVPSFWMKEMKFPLDMIWIREGRVVDISAHVPHPDLATALTQLPTYSPREAVTHVLEVPAGWAGRNGVTIGSDVIVPAVDQE